MVSVLEDVVTKMEEKMFGKTKFDQDVDLCTDAANALRFKRVYGGKLIYVDGIGWHYYDNARWRFDDLAADRLAQKIGLEIRKESINYTTTATIQELTAQERHEAAEVAKRLLKWARHSESSQRITSMLARARAHMYVNPHRLDRDPLLLNCPNGTVDLRTGEIRAHNPRDLITKVTAVDYDPGAVNEEWERVVLDICSGQLDMVKYIRRALGYASTGEVTEQILFVFIGGGSNGKDTLLGRAKAALGDYCGLAAPDLLVAPKNGRHPTEIADLLGQRLVIASESSEGAKLYESQVKLFTGNDELKARRMNGNFFEFSNSSTVVLMTNHRPVVDGTDAGIWRRINVVPFNRRYLSKEEKQSGLQGPLKDIGLWKRLDEEALPAVLNWLVRGAMEWIEGGLQMPKVVTNATDEYREDEDLLGDFFSAHCEFKSTYQVTAKGFRKRYIAWCDEIGERALSHKALWPKIRERGVSKKRTGTGVIYYGINLTEQESETQRFEY